MATLKPRSNGPSYSKTVIGTLAVDVCRGGATVSNGPSYSKTVIGTLAVDVCRGGATVLKVGGQFCERSEQKNFF